MMRAIQFSVLGDASVLKVAQVAIPSINENQILVKNHASGVNFIDTYHRSGLYKVPLPYIPGREGAGEVMQVGTNVKGFQKGDRIAYTGPNANAEFTSVSSDFCIKLPDHVSYEVGASMLLQGLTAMALSRKVHPVQKGETVLVHAAAGGTGLLIVQLCKLAGATVIGTTSTDEKKKIALDAGADHIILYKTENIKERVMELTNNKGVNAVFDGVGKSTFDISLACLTTLGTMISFGNASGKVDDIDIMKLVPNCIKLTRPSLFQLVKTKQDFEPYASELVNLLRQKKIHFHIHKIYPLSECKQAHIDLETQKSSGKLVLDCIAN